MAATIQQAIRRYGPPPGAPGIEVIERPGANAMADTRYGTVAFFGNLKRGPMGIAVPVNSRREYEDIFGDPKDARWHLYASGAHLLPDALDGYFTTSDNRGQVWITRLDLDGRARKASITLKNRMGVDCLRITAANEGRWGGITNEIPLTPVIAATARTFTLIAPGLESNEMVGAEAEFSAVPGKRYRIVANTRADKNSGEAVFTVSAQYNLVADSVSGPTALTGTADYERYRDITGTVNFPLYSNLTGTVNINGNVLTGNGTQFSTQLEVGENVYYNGEARVVTSITSNTTLTIDDSFSAVTAANATVQKDNLTLTGTGTQFTTELAPDDLIYVEIDGGLQSRTVASVETATALTLTSGFTQALTASTVSQENLEIVGTGTQFATQVSPGQFIIDPNRSGESRKVVAVTSATAIEIEKPFSGDFADAQLTKQNQKAMVYLLPANREDGLNIEIGQGTRYPDTHFSIVVKFNGSRVLQIADASLDPEDPLYVEPLVNDSNIAYRTGSINYQKWVTVENLWSSAYTTSEGDDVRPCNGSGVVLAMTETKLYTVGDFDYTDIVGNLIYPDPYALPRGYFRVVGSIAPVQLQGTLSSAGVNVTGTSTNFTTVFKPGDYLYSETAKVARKVRAVIDNTHLTLETAFPTNLAALSEGKKAGCLQIAQGYDLYQVTEVGKHFLVSYPQSLTKGFDGDTAHMIPYYFTKFADVDRNHLENATFGKNLGLIRMAVPGISDPAVQKAFAFYANQRAYEFRAELPLNYTSPAVAEAFVVQELGRNDFVTISYPSYGYIANPLGAGDRLVPLCGDIMGGESRNAVINEGYHVPFAGVNAIMPRIIKLPFEVMPSGESIVNVAGLQTVKMVYGNAVVWGARAPSISAVYDFIHIRRIQSNFVRLFLEARTLMEVLFLPNQPLLAEQVVMTMNNFARREYRKGVFSRYLSFAQAVELTSLDPSQAENSAIVNDQSGRDALVQIINGRLSIYFRYVPTGVLEVLSIHAGPDILVAQYGNTLAQSESF